MSNVNVKTIESMTDKLIADSKNLNSVIESGRKGTRSLIVSCYELRVEIENVKGTDDVEEVKGFFEKKDIDFKKPTQSDIWTYAIIALVFLYLNKSYGSKYQYRRIIDIYMEKGASVEEFEKDLESKGIAAILKENRKGATITNYDHKVAESYFINLPDSEEIPLSEVKSEENMVVMLGRYVKGNLSIVASVSDDNKKLVQSVIKEAYEKRNVMQEESEPPEDPDLVEAPQVNVANKAKKSSGAKVKVIESVDSLQAKKESNNVEGVKNAV